MECPQCLAHNKESIATKGYGYSYIGTALHCHRHPRIGQTISQPEDMPSMLPAPNTLPSPAKWTDGNPYERSRRMKHQLQLEQEEFSQTMEKTAYSSSLHHDEHTWDILNQSLSGAGFKASNKREDLGDKLSSRAMVQQIGFNPFLGETNYVEDISIRDQFLKPANTT